MAKTSRVSINVTAKTGAINALANPDGPCLALRVDFLRFCGASCISGFTSLPNIGFVIAMVTPVFVALLIVMGWKRALLVAVGLIVTQMIVQLLGDALDGEEGTAHFFSASHARALDLGISLGPVGVVLAVPLSMAIARLVEDRAAKEREAST